MPNPLTAFLGDALARVAPVLGGRVTTAGSWFDGFWDFVVDNRDRLTRDAAAPVLVLDEHVQLEQRPGRIVGGQALERPRWPVSSMVVGGDEAPRTGTRDRFDRPHDHALAEEIRGHGFTPLVGYWGVRCETSVPRDDPRGPDRVGAIVNKLPDVVALALRLADALPA